MSPARGSLADMTMPSSEWWARFLSARHGLILAWLIEGRTPGQIAETLSMDVEAVILVGTTPYQDHTRGELPFTRVDSLSYDAR
jgi:hypothetical protein